MLNRNILWDYEYFCAQRQLFLFKLVEEEGVIFVQRCDCVHSLQRQF